MPAAVYQPFPMLPQRRAQIWRYAPEYRRPRHFHREPELNLVVSGTARFGGGSTTVAVSRGDLLCWPPGCDHELLEASADFDLYVFALTEELSERVLGEHSAPALSGPTLARLPEATLLALHAGLALPVVTSESSVAEQYVAQLWRAAHDLRLKTSRRDGLGARVLRSLLLRPELDRSQRARLVLAHPSELSRAFHRELGLTLGCYRTRQRLMRFIEVVDSGRSTLLAAALTAGFGSYSQCHRAFRATLGCAPRAFFETGLRHEMAGAFEACGSAR